ncbi:MAG: hypothetical protein AAF610_10780 [Pseudomonadota bacterium]
MASVVSSTPLESGDPEFDAARIAGDAGVTAADVKKLPDDQLLDLFWSRADLKKRFSRLSEDLVAKDDEIARRDAEIARARREREGLERALSDSRTAFPALAYYHLRGLWRTANTHLISFRDDLIAQQTEREHKKQVMRFNQKREADLTSVTTEIERAKSDAKSVADELQRLQAEYDASTGWLKFFARKRLAPQIDECRERQVASRSHVQALFDRRIKIESSTWPAEKSLSLEGKRMVNLAVIALAQELCLKFEKGGLGELARSTTLKPLGAVEFGAREDCEFLIHRVSQAVDDLTSGGGLASSLRERAKFLRAAASFTKDDDTVPAAQTLGSISRDLSSDPDLMTSMPLDVDVLVDDYWDLGAVLLR